MKNFGGVLILVLLTLSPSAGRAAPPADCAWKFVGEWSYPGGTTTVNPDGTANPHCFMCTSVQTWTCQGDTYLFSNSGPPGQFSATLVDINHGRGANGSISTRVSPTPQPPGSPTTVASAPVPTGFQAQNQSASCSTITGPGMSGGPANCAPPRPPTGGPNSASVANRVAAANPTATVGAPPAQVLPAGPGVIVAGNGPAARYAPDALSAQNPSDFARSFFGPDAKADQLYAQGKDALARSDCRNAAYYFGEAAAASTANKQVYADLQRGAASGALPECKRQTAAAVPPLLPQPAPPPSPPSCPGPADGYITVQKTQDGRAETFIGLSTCKLAAITCDVTFKNADGSIKTQRWEFKRPHLSLTILSNFGQWPETRNCRFAR